MVGGGHSARGVFHVTIEIGCPRSLGYLVNISDSIATGRSSIL